MLRRACPVPTGRKPPEPRRIRAAATALIGRYLSRQAAGAHGAFGCLGQPKRIGHILNLAALIAVQDEHPRRRGDHGRKPFRRDRACHAARTVSDRPSQSIAAWNPGGARKSRICRISSG
jgi:hypothetical protein